VLILDALQHLAARLLARGRSVPRLDLRHPILPP
jgi:hypothetical protein